MAVTNADFSFCELRAEKEPVLTTIILCILHSRSRMGQTSDMCQRCCQVMNCSCKFELQMQIGASHMAKIGPIEWIHRALRQLQSSAIIILVPLQLLTC